MALNFFFKRTEVHIKILRVTVFPNMWIVLGGNIPEAHHSLPTIRELGDGNGCVSQRHRTSTVTVSYLVSRGEKAPWCSQVAGQHLVLALPLLRWPYRIALWRFRSLSFKANAYYMPSILYINVIPKVTVLIPIFPMRNLMIREAPCITPG